MSLSKVFIVSCISAIIVFVLLFNSFHHVDVMNISNEQQAAIAQIYSK